MGPDDKELHGYMPKYGVFENGKPCSEEGFPELEGLGWDNHIFDTFKEAYDYTCNWLGPYALGAKFAPNDPLDYNGYGDVIEIRTL
jgi:hypothetical protein